MKIAVVLLALVAIVHADMYLHNPRGSNNRLDEARRDRNNANRLFDSQNNNRGGYNVGNLYYYEGSILPIEWTNQHSCADPNNHCEVVLQYMCDDRLRDGSSTNTIPSNPAQCENFDCNTDLEYGMHEDYDYYLNCRIRQRNMGLYTADRNLQGMSAIYTRQNNNGQRRGYECPEERDYYPYWQPTPWRDIAVLTNDPRRCAYYQERSQNVESRFYCQLPQGYIIENMNPNRNRPQPIPIDQETCESITWPDMNGTAGVWAEVKPDERLGAPDCVETISSRDNHLGNTRGGFNALYNWTIPNTPAEHCALRIRYNISTGDYDAWDDENINGSLMRRGANVYDGSADGSLVGRAISNVSDIYTQFGMDYEEARNRGYVFRQNPVVQMFPPASNGNTFGLRLAINTNQFGRTFQDRSHSFEIRRRPTDLDCGNIYNLNVRGKRGNIVQTYPGTEYDFAPHDLVVGADDCIHIQWTGSNTNPNNNDGQGRAGTDRSNMVLLREQVYDEGMPEEGKMGHWGRSYPQHLDHENTFLGFSREDRQALAVLDNMQKGGEMSELDDAGTYFDLGPRKVTSSGIYRYLCTRNNNFTNRSQKGKVVVANDPTASKRIGWNGGMVQTNNHTLEFSRGTLTSPNVITMMEFRNSSEVGELAGKPDNLNSPFVNVMPHGHFEGVQGMANITIKLDNSASISGVTLYRASPQSNYAFTALETTVVDGNAMAQTDQGGIFVAGSGINFGAVVGGVVAGVVLLLLAIVLVGTIIYFVARPEKWQKAKNNAKKAQMKMKRSFARQV